MTIDGTVSFSSTNNYTNVSADYIWVRLGNLTAGTPGNPYTSYIDIYLTGGILTSKNLVIDSFIDAGNKVLAVTGNLSLIG